MTRFWAWLVGLLTSVLPATAPLPTPTPPPAWAQIDNYYYEQIIIGDNRRLRLDTNLTDPKPAAELYKTNNCEFLTNAGFYDTANRHLGWFQVGGRTISPAQNNNFLNGFLAISGQTAAIGFEPDKNADFGVQSGPMLIADNQPLALKIKNDQPRRRIAAGLTQTGQLVFLAVLSPESNYAGPPLADLPALLKKINPQLKTAINLDGGSASAFYSPTATLKEYSPIGGYFCYTQL
jgi:uncharacterized protein YigE (DUF2233 family)